MATKKIIFVSIESYRDPELIPTLRDLIMQAKNADRLNIVVCLQSALDIQPFITTGMILEGNATHRKFPSNLFRWHRASIKILNVYYLDSQGACWARHLIDTCYNQQDNFLQIDSHCRFTLHWDNASKRHILNQLTGDKRQLSDMGNLRTLQEYHYRVGVNFKLKTIHPKILSPNSVSWFDGLPENHHQWLTSLCFLHEKKQLLKKNKINFNYPAYDWWQFSFYTPDNKLLACFNMLPKEVRRRTKLSDNDVVSLSLKFTTAEKNPKALIKISPYSKHQKWGDGLEKIW